MAERSSLGIFATESFNSASFAVPNICFRYNGSTYDNYTADAGTVFGTEQTWLNGTSHYIYIGYTSAAWKRFGWFQHTAGSYGARTWEYWNGSAWTSFTPAYEGTAGFSVNGWVELGTLSGWASTTVNSTAAFWIRVKVASVTTAAKMYSLFLNAELSAPLKLEPADEPDGVVRDVNGTLHRRDIPLAKPFRLGIQCTRRALAKAHLFILRKIRNDRMRVTVWDYGQTSPVDPTVDSDYLSYSGFIVRVDPKVAAISKMDLSGGYAIECEIDSATELFT